MSKNNAGSVQLESEFCKIKFREFSPSIKYERERRELLLRGEMR